jgi:glycosyltransferase involved in cell wall biosynthesis
MPLSKISLMGNFGMSYGAKCDENYIADGFRNLNIEVFENEIPEQVDLILTFKNKKYGKEDIKKWKEKAPVWAWTFDNIDRFPWFYEYAKECDLWLGEELGRRERFIRDGLPFYYFPYHAVPSGTFSPVKMEKKYEVVFTGTPYGSDYRPDKFELLRTIQDKFDLHVFGNNEDGWKQQGIKNVHPPAFDEELAKIYGQSKIVLAISNCQCEGYWSIRTTQALMCGAFTLARFTPQMEKELKDNVVYFNDIPSCLEKIEYYLKNDEERETITKKGYEFALRNLTTEQRLKELLILFENKNELARP